MAISFVNWKPLQFPILKNMDSQVVQLSNTLSTQMSNKDLERSDVDANLKALSDFSNADISEARIVDDKGIIRQPMI